jgi:hypothetical protein
VNTSLLFLREKERDKLFGANTNDNCYHLQQVSLFYCFFNDGHASELTYFDEFYSMGVCHEREMG